MNPRKKEIFCQSALLSFLVIALHLLILVMPHLDITSQEVPLSSTRASQQANGRSANAPSGNSNDHCMKYCSLFGGIQGREDDNPT